MQVADPEKPASLEPQARYVRSDAVPKPEPYRTSHRDRRHPGRIIAGAICAVGAAGLAVFLGRSPALEWKVFAQFFFSPSVLRGILVTIELTVFAQLIALVGGTVLALMLQSPNGVLRTVSAAYIWVFRGVPLLVQIIVWFNLSIIVPHITIRLPVVGELVSWNTNDLINGYTAALLGLALNECAYMAEIIRGGIIAVPQGQVNAALSIGLTHSRAMRSIVMPQTIRIIIPPTGNQFIGLLKASSLVSVVGGGELLTNVQYIYGQNFAVIPLLMVASVWYLILTQVASMLQRRLERRYGVEPATRPTLIGRVLGGYRRWRT